MTLTAVPRHVTQRGTGLVAECTGVFCCAQLCYLIVVADLGCSTVCRMVDHDSAVPVYRQVADSIRTLIRDGAITNRVPSIRTLSQEYGVSHVSAAKALEVLKDEGVIVTVRGKGAFVNRAGS